MRIIKRLSTTINAQINSLVDQIENHEAVANVALSDIYEAVMKAKYQVKRVQSELEGYESRLKELEQDEKRWHERALKARGENEERALECVRRLKKVHAEIGSVQLQITGHENLETKLSEDVRKIETRFAEMKNKRNVLAARESRADAIRAVAEHQGATNVEGVFERWERQVMRDEVTGEEYLGEPVDRLDAEFKEQEEQQELKAMLENLDKKNS